MCRLNYTIKFFTCHERTQAIAQAGVWTWLSACLYRCFTIGGWQYGFTAASLRYLPSTCALALLWCHISRNSLRRSSRPSRTCVEHDTTGQDSRAQVSGPWRYIYAETPYDRAGWTKERNHLQPPEAITLTARRVRYPADYRDFIDLTSSTSSGQKSKRIRGRGRDHVNKNYIGFMLWTALGCLPILRIWEYSHVSG